MNEVYLAVLFGFILFLLLGLKKKYFIKSLFSLYFKLIVAQMRKLSFDLSRYEGDLFTTTEPKLLNYVEHYVETLEATAHLIVHEKKHPTFQGVYKTFCFIDECKQRNYKIKKVLLHKKKTQKFSPKLLQTKRQGFRRSCYFCSQPILYNMFAKLATVVEGAVIKVSSCKDCKEAMEAHQKINILFFQEQNERVHWSVYHDYIPTNDFWTMNKLKKSEKEKPLALHIVSNEQR